MHFFVSSFQPSALFDVIDWSFTDLHGTEDMSHFVSTKLDICYFDFPSLVSLIQHFSSSNISLQRIIMAASVEINDTCFCQEHFAEVVCIPSFFQIGSLYWIYNQCEECNVDFREENDAFYGVRLKNTNILKRRASDEMYYTVRFTGPWCPHMPSC